MAIIGIDIGGTEIKFVIVEKKKILKKFKIETSPFTSQTTKKSWIQDNILNSIQEKARVMKKEFLPLLIEGIGIAIAGVISNKSNFIIQTPNLPFLPNFDIAKLVTDQTGIKTVIANDANCFVLAESILGVARETKIIVGLTLGTGIGGGIIIKQEKNNRDKRLHCHLYTGAFGAAGEIGHLKIKTDGVRCSCGDYGCLEEYASEKFIKREANCSAKELFKRANQGDREAIRIYQELGKNLGYGLGMIINILDPEIIVIGGGLTNAADLFLEIAIDEAKKATFCNISREKIKILKTELGDYAGAIGATFLLT